MMDVGIFVDQHRASFSVHSSPLRTSQKISMIRSMSFDQDKKPSSSANKPVRAQAPSLKRRRTIIEDSELQSFHTKKSSPDSSSGSKKRRNHPGWNQWVNPEKELKDPSVSAVKTSSSLNTSATLLDEQKAAVNDGDEEVDAESNIPFQSRLPLNASARRSPPIHPTRLALTQQLEDSEANSIERRVPKTPSSPSRGYDNADKTRPRASVCKRRRDHNSTKSSLKLDNTQNQVDHSFPSPRSLSPALESPKGTMERNNLHTPVTAGGFSHQSSRGKDAASDDMSTIVRYLQEFGETVSAGAVIRMQHEEAFKQFKKKQGEREKWKIHHGSFTSLAEEQQKDLERKKNEVTQLEKTKEENEKERNRHILKLATVMLAVKNGGALPETEGVITVKQHEANLKELSARMSKIERNLSHKEQGIEGLSSTQNLLEEKFHAIKTEVVSKAEQQQLKDLVANMKNEVDKAQNVGTQVVEFGVQMKEIHKEIQSLQDARVSADKLEENVNKLESGFKELGDGLEVLKSQILGTSDHNSGLMTLLKQHEDQISGFKEMMDPLNPDINKILTIAEQLDNHGKAIVSVRPVSASSSELGGETEERIRKIETAVKSLGESLQREIDINVGKDDLIGDEVAGIRAAIESLQDRVAVTNLEPLSSTGRQLITRIIDQGTQTMEVQSAYTGDVQNEISQLKASNAKLVQLVQQASTGLSQAALNGLTNQTISMLKAEFPGISNIKDLDQMRHVVGVLSQDNVNFSRALQQFDTRFNQVNAAGPNQIPQPQQVTNDLIAIRSAYNAVITEMRNKFIYRDNQLSQFHRATETRYAEHTAQCNTAITNLNALATALRTRQDNMENEQISLFTRINECEELAIKKLSGIPMASSNQPSTVGKIAAADNIIDLTEIQSNPPTRPSSIVVTPPSINAVPQHLQLKSNSPAHPGPVVKSEPPYLQDNPSSPLSPDPKQAPHAPTTGSYHSQQLQPTAQTRLNSTIAFMIPQKGSLLQPKKLAPVPKPILKRKKESMGGPDTDEMRKRKQSDSENSGPPPIIIQSEICKRVG